MHYSQGVEYLHSPTTVWHKILTGGNIDGFDTQLAIRQNFPFQYFLVEQIQYSHQTSE